MRLSPVLVTMVAITAPVGASWNANAQTSDSANSFQTEQLITPTLNETPPEHQVVAVFPAAAQAAKVESTAAALTATTPRSIQNQPIIPLTKTRPPYTQQITRQSLVPTQPGAAALTATTPRSLPKQTIATTKASPLSTQQSKTKLGAAALAATTPRTAQNLQTIPTPETQPTVPEAQQTIPTPETQPTAPEGQQIPTPETQPIAPEGQQIPTPETQPTAPEGQQIPTPETQPIAPEGQQIPTPETQPTAPEGQQIPTPETQPTETPQPTLQDQPTTPSIPTPGAPQPTPTPEAAEPRVLVSEVLVTTETGDLPPELEDQVYRVIQTQAGRTTTRSQLQEDINSIFATGFFSNVRALPEDTPLGVRVSFVVQPNPVLQDVQVQANPGTDVPSVLPPNTVDEIFKEQYGRILNLRDLQEGIKQLTQRYQEQGYVLAQVVGAPQVGENGVVTLQVAEGVIEDVRVRFRNKEGQETDEKGRQIRGRTQPYIIRRELQLQPGQVFNRNIVQRDLQRVFGLGLFEDVNVSLDPGTNPSQVDVVVNVVERNSGSIAAGAGISSASGLFGTVSYQEQNLGGRNQKLGAEVQLGQRELLFDLRFTDPWIAGTDVRTSYTANLFRRRSISLVFQGEDDLEIETVDDINDRTADGDRPRVVRLGGGVVFSRPLFNTSPYEKAEWTASAGLQYQRVTLRDNDGNTVSVGQLENDSTGPLVDLTESGGGQDDLLVLQFGVARDQRNNVLQPTSGSFIRLGLDQSVPVGLGSIFLTRLRGSYSRYIPVNFTNFTNGPETLAFNVQAGTILGDLPPYEAFTLGGSNSVRGYGEGELASSRSFAQATAEYRFPVFSVISGALFFDFGTDFGSETEVGEVLDKDGTGYSYGLGVRVQSPLGPIRIDYGINDEGESRINFGIGERF